LHDASTFYRFVRQHQTRDKGVVEIEWSVSQEKQAAARLA